MIIKEIKFETDKGKFLLVDLTGNVRKFIPWDFVEESFSVKDITEEQAESISDSRYSLLALIKSLGVELFENPYKKQDDKYLELFYESCTFYNPVILKL